jgi:hypothetical protein
MKRRKSLYMVDGVVVPKKVWEARRIFGEHAAAKFSVLEVGQMPQPPTKRPSNDEID